jgi:hypothetical protein
MTRIRLLSKRTRAVACILVGLLLPAVSGARTSAWGDDREPSAEWRSRLAAPTTVSFDHQPLRQALAELAAQHKLRIELDPSLDEESDGPASPCTLQASRIKLESALNLIVHPTGLRWVVRGTGIYVTQPESLGADEMVEHRYDLSRLIQAGISLLMVQDCLSVALLDEPSFHRDETGLLLEATEADHRHAQRIVAAIEQWQSQAAQIGRVDSPGSASATEAALMRKLDERASVTFRDVPLSLALEQFRKAGIQIWVDRDSLEALEINLDTPVTTTIAGASLRSILEAVLREAGAAYRVEDEVVKVVAEGDADSELSTRIYDVRPMLAAGFKQEDLAEALQAVVCPNDWEDLGGPGAVASLPGALAVRQVLHVHAELDEVLYELRRVVTLRDRNPRVLPPSLRQQHSAAVMTALERRINRHLIAVPLDQALGTMFDRGGPPVWLDRREIVEAGRFCFEPVTARLRNATLGEALDAVLEPLNLGWYVRDELLVVTSADIVSEQYGTCVYDIHDLVVAGNPAATVIDWLAEGIDPESWERELGEGRATAVNGVLLVYQSQRNQRSISRYLDRRRPLAERDSGVHVSSR